MKFNLVIFLVILIVVVFFGVFSVHADDKPKRVKRGGLPYEDLWKEEDVKEYLDLPYITSTNDVVSTSIADIASKLERVQRIGKYQIGKNTNDLFRLRSSQISVMSFELHGEEMPVLHVSVYDYRAWDALCDRLFEYIKRSFSLWNVIPEAYTVEKTKKEYVLTRTGGDVQKYYFDLKKYYVIAIDVVSAQEGTKSEEKTIEKIEKVVRKLRAIIEEKE